MAWRRSLSGVGAASVSLAGAAYYHRPDPGGELLESHSELSRRLKSSKKLCDEPADKEPLLLQGSRAAVITVVGVISKVVLLALNSTHLVDDERHARLLDLVRDRPEGEPLLTVANHASTLDDPAVFGAMLPWEVVLRPRLMRWGLCTQEICFETPAISAFFGAGKILPIERGAGLDQSLLLDFSRRLAAGGWCHVFPEGKTVQTGTIGGRSPPKSEELGLLKWGVGKMVAHAPRTPTVVPFFHTGMQNLVAEDPATKDVLPGEPHFFNDVTIRVGNPVDVSDLIADHEKEHGALWKYSASLRAGGADDERKWRVSSLADRRLYSAITRRIEAALLMLEAEARSELGAAYPEAPTIVASGEYLKLLGK